MFRYRTLRKGYRIVTTGEIRPGEAQYFARDGVRMLKHAKKKARRKAKVPQAPKLTPKERSAFQHQNWDKFQR